MAIGTASGNFTRVVIARRGNRRSNTSGIDFANKLLHIVLHKRVVIIDSPPMLGINESAVLAGFAGQAVMVVEEGKSKLNDIQKAVARLNPEMAIGFVVNKSTNSNSDDTGYYGYYYGSEKD